MAGQYKVQMADEIRRSGYTWIDVSKAVGTLRLSQIIRNTLKTANPDKLYRTARAA